MANFLYLKFSTLFYVLSVIVLSAFALFAIMQGIALHFSAKYSVAFLLYLAGFTSLVADVWCGYRFMQLAKIWMNSGVLMKITRPRA